PWLGSVPDRRRWWRRSALREWTPRRRRERILARALSIVYLTSMPLPGPLPSDGPCHRNRYSGTSRSRYSAICWIFLWIRSTRSTSLVKINEREQKTPLAKKYHASGSSSNFPSNTLLPLRNT